MPSEKRSKISKFNLMTFRIRKMYRCEVCSKLMKTILPILNKGKIQTKVNREMKCN